MEWSNKWAPRFNEILPAGLLIIFGVAVMTAVLVYSLCSTQIRQAETGLDFATQNAAERITDWIEGHLGELGLVAADQTFIALSEGASSDDKAVQEVSNSLQAVIKDIKEYRGAMLLNKAGEIVAAGDAKTDPSLNLACDKDFQKALEGKPVVSCAFKSGRHPVFYLLQPVYKERDKRGKVEQTAENTAGVLAVTVDMNKLAKRFVKSLRSGEAGQAYIIDSTGLVIASTERDAVLENNVNDLEHGDALLKGRNGLTPFTSGESPMTAAFYTVGDWGWKLVVEVASDDLYSRAQTSRRVILLSGIVLAVFLFFAVWYIINKDASVECMSNIHKGMIYLEKIALIILLFTMIFMQFGQVVARNIFQTGIMWVDEVLRGGSALGGFSGGGACRGVQPAHQD